MPRFLPVTILVALVVFLIPVGIGAAPTQDNAAIQARDNLFQPPTLTVPAGTTIVWTNSGHNPHTVTADTGQFDSGLLAPGQTFQVTFRTPGTFSYHCQLHGAPGVGMFGTIVVTPAQPAAAATATISSPSASARPCTFVLGFQTLHDLIPDIVGDCTADETHNPDNGDALQQTTHGLLVWRKADNWTAFTDGTTTWINGPYGLQSRPNSERFDWEAAEPPPTFTPAPPLTPSTTAVPATATPAPPTPTPPRPTATPTPKKKSNYGGGGY